MQVRCARRSARASQPAVTAVALGESSMSRIPFAAVALTAAGFTVSAQAADFYRSPRSYTAPQPVLNGDWWGGPYLGGNIGYAWGSVDNNPTKAAGVWGGVPGREHF